MTHDNRAYDQLNEAVFERRVSSHFSLFECFEAPEHGWHIDDTLMAHKDGLAVTSHLLHGLVQKHGWRGAEREIQAVNAR